MRRVIIESPYAGDIELNLRYLRACMHDCIVNHNEAPFASHGLYTQPGVLDDNVPERELGIQAGFAWREVAELTVVYTDLGTSRGMEYGIQHASDLGLPVEYRGLPADVLAAVRSEARVAYSHAVHGVGVGTRAACFKLKLLDTGVCGTCGQSQEAHEPLKDPHRAMSEIMSGG